MPELGKYAAEVLTAYGVSIVLTTVLVLASIRAARKARKDLEAAEARRDER